MCEDGLECPDEGLGGVGRAHSGILRWSSDFLDPSLGQQAGTEKPLVSEQSSRSHFLNLGFPSLDFIS